jgi:hypothetical protein
MKRAMLEGGPASLFDPRGKFASRGLFYGSQFSVLGSQFTDLL